MKRLLLSVTLLITVLISACGSQQDAGNMTIRPSEFSEETRQVLDLIDDEIAFFDYTVDERIKSVSVDIWGYVNGRWENLGKSYGNVENQAAQIAIRLTGLSYDIFTIDGSGHTKASYMATIDLDEYGTPDLLPASPTRL